QDAQTLAGVADEEAAGLRTAVAVAGRLHRQEADGVDVIVAVQARLGTLVVPVDRYAVAVAGEGVEALPRVVAAGVLRRHPVLRHRAVGIRLALVEAGGAHQAERRPLWQVLRQLAVGPQRGDGLRLVHAIDAPVRHQGARPLLVVLGVVLDQEHLPRL